MFDPIIVAILGKNSTVKSPNVCLGDLDRLKQAINNTVEDDKHNLIWMNTLVTSDYYL